MPCVRGDCPLCETGARRLVSPPPALSAPGPLLARSARTKLVRPTRHASKIHPSRHPLSDGGGHSQSTPDTQTDTR